MIVGLALGALLLMPAQGGQGGFGGGGLAGGAAGSRMGPAPGEEETFKHILTPGDKTEWPIEAKAGEVLILRASSENFDPAIEVADAAGQKIAENDDEEPGKQNALLLVYFEKAGTYTAHVKNYRSTAGGLYEFKIRRFLARSISPEAPATVPTQVDPIYVRVIAPKGRIVTLSNSRNSGFEQLIAPSGKDAQWLESASGSLERAFRVEEDGAYYARTNAYGRGDSDATLAVRESTVRRAEPGRPERSSVGTDTLDVWTVEAKAGDFLRLSARAGQAPEIGFGSPPVPTDKPGEDDPFQVVEQGRKWWDSMAVLFHRDGVYEFYVRPRNGTMQYTFELANAWKPWPGQGVITANLAIGETDYYGFDAKPGYLARFEAEAKTFDVQLELFDDQWDEQDTLDDSTWRNTNAADTVFLREKGRYYLAVGCHGNGGGGAYRVSATLMAPKVLKVGERLAATLETPLDGLWSVGLEKTKTYGLRLKGSGSVVVTDPEGGVVATRSVMVSPGDTLYLFDTAKAGEYRLWVQPRGGDRSFSLRLEPIGDGE